MAGTSCTYKEMRNAYKILVGNGELKNPLGKPMRCCMGV